MKARLLGYRDLGPEVRHFDFDIPELSTLAFTPGQFLSLTTSLNGKMVTRAYSIASPPDSNRFELSLNRVKEGLLSPHLFELRTGDTIQVTGPHGSFVLKSPPRDSVFIATGTGVAPFRSMLHHHLVHGGRHEFKLLFGVRYEEGILYRGEFEQLERDHPHFAFLPTLTRPSASWTGKRGRVQQHLEDVLGARRDVDVYICGLKEMVNDVRGRLKAMGFDRKQIVYERYD